MLSYEVEPGAYVSSACGYLLRGYEILTAAPGIEYAHHESETLLQVTPLELLGFVELI